MHLPDNVKQLSSYVRFMYIEQSMFKKYPKFWPLAPFVHTCGFALPLDETRKAIFIKLKNICKHFSEITDFHLTQFEKVKGIPFKHPIEEKLNCDASKRMKKIFLKHTSELEGIVNTLNNFRLTCFEHYRIMKQALELAEQPDEDARLKLVKTISECENMRKELNQLRLEVGTKMISLDERIQHLSKRGEALGPVFTTNPAIFFFGVPMIIFPKSELAGKPNNEKIEIIETIKGERCVMTHLMSIHFLFLHAIQAMRKMEKGIKGLIPYSLGEKGFGRYIKTSSIELSKIEKIDPNWLDIPPQLICPLSKTLLEDPVTISTGHTFSRKALLTYLEKNSVCPISQKKIISNLIIPNFAIKSLISRFVDKEKGKISIKYLEAKEFECPITLELFTDALLTSSGNTYEAEPIKIMLKKTPICPLSGVHLKPEVLIPNIILQNIIKSTSHSDDKDQGPSLKKEHS